jgi:hypothetical protein
MVLVGCQRSVMMTTVFNFLALILEVMTLTTIIHPRGDLAFLLGNLLSEENFCRILYLSISTQGGSWRSYLKTKTDCYTIKNKLILSFFLKGK